jgi:hypothetical protein
MSFTKYCNPLIVDLDLELVRSYKAVTIRRWLTHVNCHILPIRNSSRGVWLAWYTSKQESYRVRLCLSNRVANSKFYLKPSSWDVALHVDCVLSKKRFVSYIVTINFRPLSILKYVNVVA